MLGNSQERKQKNMKKLIAILLALSLSLTLCLTAASAEGSIGMGKQFPDFTVTDSDGITFIAGLPGAAGASMSSRT